MKKKKLIKEIKALSRALVKVTQGDAHMMKTEDWEAVSRAHEHVDGSDDEDYESDDDWQPIKTVPKKGRYLLWVETDYGGEIMVLDRDSKGNFLYQGEPTFCHTLMISPTHWKQLPKGPKE